MAAFLDAAKSRGSERTGSFTKTDRLSIMSAAMCSLRQLHQI
jgi:hypothetical protein